MIVVVVSDVVLVGFPPFSYSCVRVDGLRKNSYDHLCEKGRIFAN